MHTVRTVTLTLEIDDAREVAIRLWTALNELRKKAAEDPNETIRTIAGRQADRTNKALNAIEDILGEHYPR